MQDNQKFRFKHSLGQNFLKDDELLGSIVDDAQVIDDSNVLEIGAGAGALTTKLADKAKNGHVMSVEIDRSLQKILDSKLKKYSNVNLVFGDILSISPQDIKDEFGGGPFKVVANLPYYITTPILEYLLDNDFLITDITVMVQYEVAKRLSAEVGTKDYGAITPILQMYGQPYITRIVGREMFTPRPNVDSAILRINIKKNNDIDKKYVSSVIKKCFLMRRKTLQNNLMSAFNLSKEQSEGVIQSLSKDKLVRAEALSLDDFIALSNILKEQD